MCSSELPPLKNEKTYAYIPEVLTIGAILKFNHLIGQSNTIFIC